MRHTPTFKHRFIEPRLPPVSAYLELFQQIYDSGTFSNFGPVSRRFEAQILAKYGDANECCVAAANATAGLSAALIAANVKGDVLVPAFTFPASSGAVRAANLRPVIADVDEKTWALSVEIIARHCEASLPAAVMLVSPFGINHGFDEEIAFCLARGIAVVIDNAAGLGVPRKPRCTDLNLFEVFSLHATKAFAVGEGGLIFGHAERLQDIQSALNFGLGRGYQSKVNWGFNGKLSEFQAAIGLAQLDIIDEAVRYRQEFAAAYLARLPTILPGSASSSPWQCFPYLLSSKSAADQLEQRAAMAGIELRRYYRPSLSNWPEIDTAHACPVSESLADRMCALPVRATNDLAKRQEIVEALASLIEQIEGNTE
ncbi:hypothetical protein DWF00_15570 [Bosea caraganae]|uniref:DegT/DnrJ/EryC1/StrS family aminotransferase n=1 Tax=Bosea caraganae TaxID=2763117 RepID=A0A370L7V6_9HYPH|nr:DegT/DnrJ/EryC1/StrS family aminotransferase [Bosea caraganae]RDJ25408.1 hypothetical protein DWE98_11815 [Bosea caraganae]RDJ25807.1 hypothetical protein DWF00_15570 [Bosea caraganae]